MSPRTGRPKMENPKSERVTARLTKEESDVIEAYCSQENIDKATAVRRGIRKLEEDLKK